MSGDIGLVMSGDTALAHPDQFNGHQKAAKGMAWLHGSYARRSGVLPAPLPPCADSWPAVQRLACAVT